MKPHIEIGEHLEGPFKGLAKVTITCTKEDLAKFQAMFAGTAQAMNGAAQVRNLVQGGLGQLFAAAAMLKK